MPHIGDLAGVSELTRIRYNQAVADQVGFSSDTYLAGSFIAIPSGKLKVGSRYRCVFDVNKTAAGTASPVIYVRVGTAGTTADTARCTLTFRPQTAAADSGMFQVWVTVRQAGSSAVLHASGSLTHQLDITGFADASSPKRNETSASFDITPAGTGIGLSVDAGASATWTVYLVQAEMGNLA